MCYPEIYRPCFPCILEPPCGTLQYGLFGIAMRGDVSLELLGYHVLYPGTALCSGENSGFFGCSSYWHFRIVNPFISLLKHLVISLWNKKKQSFERINGPVVCRVNYVCMFTGFYCWSSNSHYIELFTFNTSQDKGKNIQLNLDFYEADFTNFSN